MWLLVEAVLRVVKACLDLLLVEQTVTLDLSQALIGEVPSQDVHGLELLANLWNLVGIRNVSLAGWASHEVETDSLRAPSVSQHLSEAVSVEEVTAAQFKEGLVTQS